MPWLLVGLGNPGPRYAGNRHNIGFMVAEELARRMGEPFRDKFDGRMARGRLAEEDVVVLEPLTFMNRSGTSVAAAAAFFKVDLPQVVIIHDELDLPFASLRIKVGGGHGGHNGLRSIFQHLGKDFLRVRCGIGRPADGDVTGHVLGDFAAAERGEVASLIDTAADAVETVLRVGPERAMNAFHTISNQGGPIQGGPAKGGKA